MNSRTMGLRFAFATLLFSLAFSIFAAQAWASGITVYVGYPGGPYYEKARYTDEEIEAMSDDVLYEYSVFDSLPSLRKGFARGIELKTLFEASGINADELWRFYFNTLDSYISDDGGYGTNAWYYDSLVNTTRYYFSTLPHCFEWQYTDIHNGSLIPDTLDYGEAWQGAVTVPTVLAYESSFNRLRYEYDIDTIWNETSGMGSNNKYRLMFGQLEPMDSGAMYSAYGIRSITCIFPNTPVISFDFPKKDFKVGEEFTFTPALDALDDEIVEHGIMDINWACSDPSVAQITQNADGSVTVKIVGEGAFSVTATYGNSSYKEFVTSTTVSGGGSGNGEGDGQGDGKGDASDKGGDSGEQGGSTEKDGQNSKAEESAQDTGAQQQAQIDLNAVEEKTIQYEAVVEVNAAAPAAASVMYRLSDNALSQGGSEGLKDGDGQMASAMFSGLAGSLLGLLIVGIILNLLAYQLRRDRKVKQSRFFQLGKAAREFKSKTRIFG